MLFSSQSQKFTHNALLISIFLNLFSLSPPWLLLFAPVALSPPPHSHWRWPPCIPQWPESSSQMKSAGRKASARRPLCKSAGGSGPTGQKWPKPRVRPAATQRAATAEVWSWWKLPTGFQGNSQRTTWQGKRWISLALAHCKCNVLAVLATTHARDKQQLDN